MCRFKAQYGCVMHLMRVVEVALRAYGTGLNSSGNPTWTPEKRVFFEESHAHFHSVRLAWRNPFNARRKEVRRGACRGHF